MNLVEILTIISQLSSLAVILGLIVEFYRMRRERGYQTYIQTTSALRDLERLTMEKENEDILESFCLNAHFRKLSSSKKKRYLFWSNLISIFEVVHIAEDKHWFEKEEFEGWNEYIKDLAGNSEDFRETWGIEKKYYYEKFRKYMDELMNSQNSPSLKND